MTKIKPDIRAITKLVPPSGNLVQGQSELPIDQTLATEAAQIIAASQNHYGAAEGVTELRQAIAEKIRIYNHVSVDADAAPFEVIVTPGGTGALVAIADVYLRNKATLVFEPYYPYHRKIIEQFGGKTETFALDEKLEFDKDELRRRCLELKDRNEFPLAAIIVCTPANPSGKVMTANELQTIAEVCRELDLLCIADEVYEHYVTGDDKPHVSMATLPAMRERTITVNSFSKSWNISGWRLGYAFGDGKLIAPLNNATNIIYVCATTPLQTALSRVLMAQPDYYERLRATFNAKRLLFVNAISELGFEVYNSGSAFYVWAQIPQGYAPDALKFNEMLMHKAQIAAVPGGAFADNDLWDNSMRFCIAREDRILTSALEKLQNVLR